MASFLQFFYEIALLVDMYQKNINEVLLRNFMRKINEFFLMVYAFFKKCQFFLKRIYFFILYQTHLKFFKIVELSFYLFFTFIILSFFSINSFAAKDVQDPFTISLKKIIEGFVTDFREGLQSDPSGIQDVAKSDLQSDSSSGIQGVAKSDLQSDSSGIEGVTKSDLNLSNKNYINAFAFSIGKGLHKNILSTLAINYSSILGRFSRLGNFFDFYFGTGQEISKPIVKDFKLGSFTYVIEDRGLEKIWDNTEILKVCIKNTHLLEKGCQQVLHQPGKVVLIKVPVAFDVDFSLKTYLSDNGEQSEKMDLTNVYPDYTITRKVSTKTINVKSPSLENGLIIDILMFIPPEDSFSSLALLKPMEDIHLGVSGVINPSLEIKDSTSHKSWNLYSLGSYIKKIVNVDKLATSGLNSMIIENLVTTLPVTLGLVKEKLFDLDIVGKEFVEKINHRFENSQEKKLLIKDLTEKTQLVPFSIDQFRLDSSKIKTFSFAKKKEMISLCNDSQRPKDLKDDLLGFILEKAMIDRQKEIDSKKIGPNIRALSKEEKKLTKIREAYNNYNNNLFEDDYLLPLKKNCEYLLQDFSVDIVRVPIQKMSVDFQNNDSVKKYDLKLDSTQQQKGWVNVVLLKKDINPLDFDENIFIISDFNTSLSYQDKNILKNFLLDPQIVKKIKEDFNFSFINGAKDVKLVSEEAKKDPKSRVMAISEWSQPLGYAIENLNPQTLLFKKYKTELENKKPLEEKEEKELLEHAQLIESLANQNKTSQKDIQKNVIELTSKIKKIDHFLGKKKYTSSVISDIFSCLSPFYDKDGLQISQPINNYILNESEFWKSAQDLKDKFKISENDNFLNKFYLKTSFMAAKMKRFALDFVGYNPWINLKKQLEKLSDYQFKIRNLNINELTPVDDVFFQLNEFTDSIKELNDGQSNSKFRNQFFTDRVKTALKEFNKISNTSLENSKLLPVLIRLKKEIVNIDKDQKFKMLNQDTQKFYKKFDLISSAIDKKINIWNSFENKILSNSDQKIIDFSWLKNFLNQFKRSKIKIPDCNSFIYGVRDPIKKDKLMDFGLQPNLNIITQDQLHVINEIFSNMQKTKMLDIVTAMNDKDLLYVTFTQAPKLIWVESKKNKTKFLRFTIPEFTIHTGKKSIQGKFLKWALQSVGLKKFKISLDFRNPEDKLSKKSLLQVQSLGYGFWLNSILKNKFVHAQVVKKVLSDSDLKGIDRYNVDQKVYDYIVGILNKGLLKTLDEPLSKENVSDKIDSL